METKVTLPPTPSLSTPRADVSFIDGGGCQTHLDLITAAATRQQALQSGAGNKIGVAANQSERAKRAKYEPLVMTPLVLESGGRVCIAFFQFVTELLPSGPPAQSDCASFVANCRVDAPAS